MLIQLEARGTNDFGVGILQGLQAAPAGLKGNRQEEFNAVSSANAQSVATSAASIGLAEAEEDESESSSSSSDEEGESSDSSDDEEDESSTAAPARSGAASPSGITPATSPTSETSAEDNPPFGRNARIPTPHPFNVIQSQSSVSPSNAFPQSNVVATSTSLAFAQSSVAALPITATAGRSHLLETSSAAATLGSGSDDVESEDSGDSSDDESESGSESETFRKRVRRVKVRRFKRSALRRRQADRLLSNRIDTRETALSASDSDSDVEAGTVGQADQTSLKDAAETAQASSDSDSESASSHNESESSSDSDYGTKATASQQTSQDIVTLGRRHRQSFKEGVIQLPFKEGVIAVQESPDFHLPPLETVQTTAQSLDLFALGPMPLAITQSDLSDETRRQSIAQNDLEPQEASSRPNLGDATPAFTLAPDTSPLRQRRMKRAQLPDGVSVSAGSDGTAQVFGLVDDSDKPIVVTEECAASLDRSLVIIERQG